MNAEVIKAMNKKEKKHTFRKWLKKHGNKVLTVLFFPFVVILWLMLKFNTWLDKRAKARNAWDADRAKEIFNYYIPRRAEWCAKDKSFYFFDNGYGWGMSFAKKYLKRKDRKFWKEHNGFLGGKMREYLMYEFELEGFTKELGNCSDGWTEISFTMIKKEA